MGNKAKDEKDLVIMIQGDLLPEKYGEVTKEAYRQLMNVKVAINYMDENNLKKLILIVNMT